MLRCSPGLISVEIINTHQSTGPAAPYMCGIAGAFNISITWIFQLDVDFAAEVVTLLPAFQLPYQTCELRVMGTKSSDGEALHGVLEQSWMKRFGSRPLPVLGNPVETSGPLALDSEYSPSLVCPNHPYLWHLITCRQLENCPPN